MAMSLKQDSGPFWVSISQEFHLGSHAAAYPSFLRSRSRDPLSAKNPFASFGVHAFAWSVARRGRSQSAFESMFELKAEFGRSR